MSEKHPDAALMAKVAQYTEILNRNPQSTVFVPLAEVYRQIGLLDDAADIATQGLRHIPDSSPGYTVLGRIYAQQEEWPLAVEALEKALKLDKGNVAALKSLAKVLTKTGEDERASQLLHLAAELEADNAGMKKILQAKGTGSSLEPRQEKVTSPSSGEIRPETPDGHAKKSFPEPGDPITTATIADIYLKQGFPRRALKVLSDLLRNDPHNIEIQVRMADLKKQIETEEALPLSQELSDGPASAPIAPDAGWQGLGEEGPPEKHVAGDLPAARIEVLNRWLDSIRKRRSAHV